jgi:hypothetical protein
VLDNGLLRIPAHNTLNTHDLQGYTNLPALPPWASTWAKELVKTVWVSPAGSASALHWHQNHNLLTSKWIHCYNKQLFLHNSPISNGNGKETSMAHHGKSFQIQAPTRALALTLVLILVLTLVLALTLSAQV